MYISENTVRAILGNDNYSEKEYDKHGDIIYKPIKDKILKLIHKHEKDWQPHEHAIVKKIALEMFGEDFISVAIKPNETIRNLQNILASKEKILSSGERLALTQAIKLIDGKSPKSAVSTPVITKKEAINIPVDNEVAKDIKLAKKQAKRPAAREVKANRIADLASPKGKGKQVVVRKGAIVKKK